MKPVYLAFLSVGLLASCGKNPAKDPLIGKIDAALDTAAEQYRYMTGRGIPEGRFPKTYHAANDSLETSDSGWWCSGFYPGTLLELAKAENDNTLAQIAMDKLEELKKEQYNTHTHDLGFMMFCSFGNALDLAPNKGYDSILDHSAQSLSTRFVEKPQVLRSWDSAPWNGAKDDECLVIIDNMMNLELLFWASDHTGDPKYRDIAIKHADQTMAHHFRKDYSSYHLVIYNEETGEVARRITNQGYADNSSWSRGQAWGLYGYTVMYRETHDPKYLEQAEHIADFLLNNPHMPEDLVPYWDYDAPGIPDALRDSSAAAVMASALLELKNYSDGPRAEGYRDAAKTMLTTLLSPEYFAEKGTNGGFLLKHGVGNMPQNSEVDVPLSYGDYYLVEAMMRYKKR